MAASDGKFLSDHFSRQNSCSEINSSSMMTGSEERGLGNIFQLLNQMATETSGGDPLQNHFTQMLEQASSGTDSGLLPHEETPSSDCYADCSNTVTSSQTFASCRFQEMSPHDNPNFEQNQTVQSTSTKHDSLCPELYDSQHHDDGGSDVSTSLQEFGSSRDEKYWERRRKNNVAAKKSRDARRVRENQLRLKVLCLENANQVLRTQVDRERQRSKELEVKVEQLEKKLSCGLQQ